MADALARLLALYVSAYVLPHRTAAPSRLERMHPAVKFMRESSSYSANELVLALAAEDVIAATLRPDHRVWPGAVTMPHARASAHDKREYAAYAHVFAGLLQALATHRRPRSARRSRNLRVYAARVLQCATRQPSAGYIP
ncbi:hypothetical protein K438DRAFT_1981264 [Mycena galopus ATCC 62051]|nr:hypothetical protein K438DRAFT_1981264 [Mycena galopus ATCC 62051]